MCSSTGPIICGSSQPVKLLHDGEGACVAACGPSRVEVQPLLRMWCFGAGVGCNLQAAATAALLLVAQPDLWGWGLCLDLGGVRAPVEWGSPSSGRKAWQGSAVCAYSMEDVQRAMNGRFKEFKRDCDKWSSVMQADVPEPRPGAVSGWWPSMLGGGFLL